MSSKFAADFDNSPLGRALTAILTAPGDTLDRFRYSGASPEAGAGDNVADRGGSGLGNVMSIFGAVTALGAALRSSLSPLDASNGPAMASPEESVALAGPTNRDAAALPPNVQNVSLADLGGFSPAGPGRSGSAQGAGMSTFG